MRMEQLMEQLSLITEDAEKIKKIKGIIEETTSPMSYRSVIQWKMECFSTPSPVELKMEALAELLVGDFRSLRDVHIIDRGNPYIPTIIYDISTHTFTVGAWGDFI